MPPELDTDVDPIRRLTQRQEDGGIYKMMAFIVFAILCLPIGFASSRGLDVPFDIKLLLGFFAFDVGWDLALLATGRGNMLIDSSPKLIVGKALERIVPVGLVLLCVSLDGDVRTMAIVVSAAWGLAPLLTASRSPAAI